MENMNAIVIYTLVEYIKANSMEKESKMGKTINLKETTKREGEFMEKSSGGIPFNQQKSIIIWENLTLTDCSKMRPF